MLFATALFCFTGSDVGSCVMTLGAVAMFVDRGPYLRPTSGAFFDLRPFLLFLSVLQSVQTGLF